jgi:hypothetical protein
MVVPRVGNYSAYSILPRGGACSNTLSRFRPSLGRGSALRNRWPNRGNRKPFALALARDAARIDLPDGLPNRIAQ